MDVEVFLDGPKAKSREAIHLLFAGEMVDPQHITPTPDLTEVESTEGIELGVRFQNVTLQTLVRAKLNDWRLKDRVHLLELINVGQVELSLPARFPPALGQRLQQLLDNPDG